MYFLKNVIDIPSLPVSVNIIEVLVASSIGEMWAVTVRPPKRPLELSILAEIMAGLNAASTMLEPAVRETHDLNSGIVSKSLALLNEVDTWNRMSTGVAQLAPQLIE